MPLNFEFHYHRDPKDGPACAEYALIPEGMRRTLELKPGQASGCRRDAVTSPALSHINFFNILNAPRGHAQQWQLPPGPPVKPIVGATLRVQGNVAHAAVRYADGTCSPWWSKDLGPGRPCETPMGEITPCKGEPCPWPPQGQHGGER